MSSSGIQNSSYFPNFESPNSCLKSKWIIVALAVSSLVFLGAAAFGATGLFISQLPQWLANAVGTIGHSGCLAMLMWGTILGGACAISIIALVKINSSNSTINHDVPTEQTAVPSSNESIETLNAQLIEAATNGRTEEIQTLLNQGANTEATDRFQRTPLLLAAQIGYVEVIRVLLQHGANIEATDYIGRTAIDHANTAEIRQILERRTQTLNAQLIESARYGRTEEILTLLNQGANIEARDQVGMNSLMWAARAGDIDTATLLLDHGANINTTDHDGRTAIDHANTAEIRQILERRSQTLNAQFMEAVRNGQVQEMTTLLNRGANIEVTDQEGRTPLIHAAFDGQDATVTALLNRRANIEARDHFGWTPLICAAFKGHINVMMTLLNHGANINAIDHEGKTAIQHASGEVREALLNWTFTQVD